jgi:hypothetical protein
METPKTKIILKDDNNAQWRFQTTMQLKNKRVYKNIQFQSYKEYAKAKALKIDQTQETTKLVEWEEDDQVALSIVGMHVDTKFNSIILESKSAYDAWIKLEQLFQGINNANLFKLKYQLNTEHQNNNETLLDYLNRIVLINNKIKDLGEQPLDDYDLSMKIISTINNNYEPIRMACLMINKKELTINYLSQRFAMELSTNNNNNNNSIQNNN